MVDRCLEVGNVLNKKASADQWSSNDVVCVIQFLCVGRTLQYSSKQKKKRSVYAQKGKKKVSNVYKVPTRRDPQRSYTLKSNSIAT